MASVMRQFQDNSYLFGGNAAFIEELYEKYLVNPQSVPEEWREYFDRLQVLPGNTVKDIARAPVEQSFVQRAKRGEFGGGGGGTLPPQGVGPPPPRRSRCPPSVCRSPLCFGSRRTASRARAGPRSIRSGACRARRS